MKYTFNKKVTFDVVERTLVSEGGLFLLTNPACRLLLVLIEKNGELVEKETLLTKVWDEFGLVSSEGSLYNNISMLRKGFFQVGITNGLETIPKKGVRLMLDSIDIVLPATNDNISNQTFPPPPFLEKKVGGGWKWYKWGVIVMSSILLLSVFAMLLHNYISAHTQNYTYYANVDKCAINYFSDVKYKRVKDFFSGPRGKSILKLCTVPSVVYYDDSNVDSNTHKNEVIISYCELKGGQGSECKNFVSIDTN